MICLLVNGDQNFSVETKQMCFYILRSLFNEPIKMTLTSLTNIDIKDYLLFMLRKYIIVISLIKKKLVSGF